MSETPCSPIAEAPPAAAIRVQLDRILSSAAFPAGERRRAFLRFVVEEALAGRAEKLKGVAIAIAVFGRDETFDQQVDPVVRLEARRLRRDLDSYYVAAGQADPIRISIPKGGYVPLFTAVTSGIHAEATAAAVPPGPPRAAGLRGLRRIHARTVSVNLLAASLVAFAVVAATVWHGLQHARDAAPRPDDAATASVTDPAIAVLPLLNLSGDPDQQYLCDGLSEQLVTELARSGHFSVMSLGNALADETVTADPREIGRKLGVDHVVEGSVRTFGRTVKVSVRLVDARNGRHLWVGEYQDTFGPRTIFDLQESVAQRVAGTLTGTDGVLAGSAIPRTDRECPHGSQGCAAKAGLIQGDAPLR